MNDNVNPLFKPLFDAITPHMNDLPELPTSNTINITQLIEKAEQLAHDGKLCMAASAEIPVQILAAEWGKKYKISITATLL